MRNSFVKIIHFTKLVKINGRLREFNYKKNNTAGDYVFDIDSADERGNRVFFRLYKNENEWAITSKHPLPDWIEAHKEAIISGLEEGVLSN